MTLEQLKEIIKHRQRLDAAIDKLIEAGLDINGTLFDAIWNGVDAADDLIDPDGWIYWYLTTKSDRRIKIDDVWHECETVEQLYELFFK
jgi:hypothetical protein